MPELTEQELAFRKELAIELLNFGRNSLDDVKFVDFQLLEKEDLTRIGKIIEPLITFPDGFTPVPQEINPKPKPSAKLPNVDIVVVTWTIAEQEALADIFTPGNNRNKWYRYDRFFEHRYASLTRSGSPASSSKRIGSYFQTEINGKRVLCFKSEFHLNQDGIRDFDGNGNTSLPVRAMFKQIIEETECSHILTVGTCGGIKLEHDLGDVLVTRAARFHCRQEFKDAPFNNTTFSSEWNIPTTFFDKAEELMAGLSDNLLDPVFGPPTKRHQGGNWTLNTPFIPNIIHEAATEEAKRIDPLHPILTTDFFEFGNSTNADELFAEGCGVEMGDAVLGLACTEDIENPPFWAVVRNLSDPQINGDLSSARGSLNMQAHWAVWYYESFGYWTSVMSAVATWGIIAGLSEE